jgi:hypothetical protein
MNARLLTFLLAILLPLTAITQPKPENLAADMPFFENKAREYQQWLENKGFSKALKVETVQFKKDKNNQVDSTEIELLMALTATNVDSASGQWDQLKRDFDGPADTLDAYLYRTFVHKMEIPETQGNIQIYVRDPKGVYIPCFYVWIWSEDGRIVSLKKREGLCKDKKFEVTVPAYTIKTSGRGKTARVTKTKARTADEVFKTVLQYVNETMINIPRYQTEVTDRHPSITDSSSTASRLVFTVADMGKEVLTNQNRSWWEKYVNVNTIAMERLEFKFEYRRATTNDNSFTLNCTIDGKYGSGIFKPRKNGYMNMENDFDDFFETYKNKFREGLTKRLQLQP